MTIHASTINAALSRDLRAQPSGLEPDVPFPMETFPDQIDSWAWAPPYPRKAAVPMIRKTSR